MTRLRWLAFVAMVLLAPPAWSAESVGGDKAFSFVALGDMPYNLPGDVVKFDRLISAINAMKPAFTRIWATSNPAAFRAATLC
ncbi:MAG: hypothetical protein JWR73_56 [Tardiphaga sp.]|nr:hypothetical protein [Tardiphaga sp.]